jgi:hypothetical protein
MRRSASERKSTPNSSWSFVRARVAGEVAAARGGVDSFGAVGKVKGFVD